MDYTPKTENELREIAQDMYEKRIFSTRHLPKEDMRFLAHIFLPLAAIKQKDIVFLMQNKITFFYEYYAVASSKCIGGYPQFASLRFLMPDEDERMTQYYKDYRAHIKEFYRESDSPELKDLGVGVI